MKDYRKTPNGKIRNREHTVRKKDDLKLWRKNNPDKVSVYNKTYQQHKKHNISNKELKDIYEYANFSCMYCGISEKEHLEIFKEKLHKEHAINDGSNGIDNCVLACKRCNSEKHTEDWDQWYNSNNILIQEFYTEERKIKIQQWLDKFKEI
jgi:5-methylcytosine-specific restriction endonuclease McrA